MKKRGNASGPASGGRGTQSPGREDTRPVRLSGVAPRLYERALEILAARIEDGSVQAGSQLSESGVAAQFGISRAPARRALHELERRGLIHKAEGRGFIVRRGRRHDAPAAGAAFEPREEMRLVSSSTWERIYSDVESEIIARIPFAPWRVNEAELARYYEVSRTVARDVVARLQTRGIVRKDDRSRWYAPALTPDYIDELYELRWVLEPLALKKAAPRVSPDFLERMRNHLEKATANAREITGATLDALEKEMHVALLRHCEHRALMQAVTLSQSLLIAHRFLYVSTPQLFETEPFLPEHIEIVDRLASGDIEGAAYTLEQHLRVSRDRAVARVDVVVQKFKPDELPYLRRLET